MLLLKKSLGNPKFSDNSRPYSRQRYSQGKEWIFAEQGKDISQSGMDICSRVWIFKMKIVNFKPTIK